MFQVCAEDTGVMMRDGGLEEFPMHLSRWARTIVEDSDLYTGDEEENLDERDIRQSVMARHPMVSKAQRRKARNRRMNNWMAKQRWHTKEESGE